MSKISEDCIFWILGIIHVIKPCSQPITFLWEIFKNIESFLTSWLHTEYLKMFLNRSKIMTRDVLNTISLKVHQSINNDRHNHGVYCLLHLTWADLATLHWICVIDRFRSFYTDLIHSSVSSNNQLLANSLSHLPSFYFKNVLYFAPLRRCMCLDKTASPLPRW